MNNRLSKIEIVLTAIIFLLACIGISLTVVNRVDKGNGELTAENYADYMQVTCSGGSGFGDGITMSYTCNIIVTASPCYKLENVTISFSLKSQGSDLYEGAVTANVEADKSHSEKCSFEYQIGQGGTFGSVNIPDLEIAVKSVSGTYIYQL